MRVARILSILLLGSVFVPNIASSKPSSITLRTGYIPRHENGTHPVSLSLSSTWNQGKQTALWSSIGYIREQRGSYYVVAPLDFASSRGSNTTHLVPVTVGLKAFANDWRHPTRGLFAEAGPTAYLGSYHSGDGRSHFAALGGLQCGMGIRFGVDECNFELGTDYYLAEAFGRHADAIGRIGTDHEVDYNLFSVYGAVGWGK